MTFLIMLHPLMCVSHMPEQAQYTLVRLPVHHRAVHRVRVRHFRMSNPPTATAPCLCTVGGNWRQKPLVCAQVVRLKNKLYLCRVVA